MRLTIHALFLCFFFFIAEDNVLSWIAKSFAVLVIPIVFAVLTFLYCSIFSLCRLVCDGCGGKVSFPSFVVDNPPWQVA